MYIEIIKPNQTTVVLDHCFCVRFFVSYQTPVAAWLPESFLSNLEPWELDALAPGFRDGSGTAHGINGKRRHILLVELDSSSPTTARHLNQWRAPYVDSSYRIKIDRDYIADLLTILTDGFNMARKPSNSGGTIRQAFMKSIPPRTRTGRAITSK